MHAAFFVAAQEGDATMLRKIPAVRLQKKIIHWV